MFSRRSAIFVASASLLALNQKGALAEEDQINFDRDIIFPPLDPFEPFGYSRPSEDELKAATVIFESAPTGPAPLAIARWFATKPDKHYIEQWPASDHWNPVIVEFFRKGTGLQASNDMINWCAAFVNYCIVRANKRGTLSPSSQSFLPDYQHKVPGSGKFVVTSNPREGDIAIFTCHRLDNDAPIGLGHVGFLDGPFNLGSQTVPLLAGNTAGNGSYSSISSKPFPTSLNMSRDLGNGTRIKVVLKLNSFVSIV